MKETALDECFYKFRVTHRDYKFGILNRDALKIVVFHGNYKSHQDGRHKGQKTKVMNYCLKVGIQHYHFISRGMSNCGTLFWSETSQQLQYEILKQF